MNSIFNMVVAGSAGLITFSVARRVLRERLTIGSPNLLAGLVAGMAFLGLLQSGDGLISAILIPYAALAFALLLLFLWRRLTEFAKPLTRHQRNPGWNPTPPSRREFNLSSNPDGSLGHDRSTGETFRSKERTLPTPDPNDSSSTETNWWSS